MFFAITCGRGEGTLLCTLPSVSRLQSINPFFKKRERKKKGSSHVCALFFFLSFLFRCFYKYHFFFEFLNAHILSWEMFFSACVSHSPVISRLGFFFFLLLLFFLFFLYFCFPSFSSYFQRKPNGRHIKL